MTPKISSFYRLAALALIASLGAACSSTYEVRVHSTARAQATPQELESYTIRSKNPELVPGSLRYKEAAQHIKTALSGQGMWEAPNAELADLVVEIDYGIEPARVKYDTVQVPIFVPVTEDEGSLERSASERRSPRPANGSVPRARRLVGYQEIAVPVVVREKHLAISGRENREPDEGRPPTEIFRVSASIEDEGNDLRARLPVLASAVMDQLGRTTEGIATARVSERDEAVSFIKRGM